MKMVIFAALLMLMPFSAGLVQSQDALLTPNQTVTGSVPRNGSSTWRFQAYTGSVMSFLVEGIDGFDPILTLSDANGRELTGSDDFDYPNSLDALLEAVTLARTNIYAITISGYGGSGGDYRLTMMPGYARSLPVSAEDRWQSESQALTVETGADGVRMALQNITATTALAYNTALSPLADFYFQARVESVTGGDGWIVAAALRRAGSTYYLLEFNHLGRWRFSAVDHGTPRVIRDWTPHPNIVAGTTQFTFGVMARGAGFDVFYNGGFVGGVSDTSISQAGAVGLGVGTVSSLISSARVHFDELLITIPYHENTSAIIPQRVIVSDAASMSLALQRTRVVSPIGELALTVPTVTVEYARAGVNRQMVGMGTTYGNFAAGAHVTLQQRSVGIGGCGLVVRARGDADYTLLYFDSSGGYGVSQRTTDRFLPGLFGSDPRFATAPGTTGRHHMLVIADQERLYYYLDGYLVGTAVNPPQVGEIGAAVVNFDNAVTTCSFADLWLWRW
jgi:hypothetical protein